MEKERVTESTFGALLRRHRLAAGLSQEALAERARMSVNGIGALERGDRQFPYRETVTLLAQALSLAPAAEAELEAAAVRPRQQRAPAAGEARAADRRDRAINSRSATECGSNNNLPLILTRFLGRERELAELHTLLNDERLVTLTGTGGIGKTRAALQAAACVGHKDDGVWFVNLAPLADPTLVPSTVASAMSIPTSGERPIAQSLLTALRRQHTLIVLDNCEHVVAAAAELANSVVLTCPRVNLLVTSREPLNTSGERVYRLPSLEVPPPDTIVTTANAATYSAIALFAERAQAADVAFALTDTSAPIVADIVRRLDGIPLAIELAAARVGTLGLSALAQRLDQRFRLLTTGSRSALPRHQTLRATFDWSHDLLSEAECALFRRVAIFSGGWTLEAAEAVCTDDLLDTVDVIDVLGTLVEKSLVVADDDGTNLRYRLLESSRAYALEKLTESGERTTLAGRHARQIGVFVGRADERSWTEPLRRWLAHVDPESDNIRAALAWTFGTGDYALAGQIAGQLDRYWYERDPAEGLRWAEAVLAQLDAAAHPAVLGRLLHTSACLSNAKRSVEAAERAVSLLDAAGDSRTLAWAFSQLANSLLQTGRFEEAAAALDRALQLYEDTGLARTRRFAQALLKRGLIQLGQHRLNDARTSCAAGLALSESLGDDEEVSRARLFLAEVEFDSGNARRALELVLQVKGVPGLSTRIEAVALTNSAAYLLALGDAGEAQMAARAALLFLRRAYTRSPGGEIALFAACAILHLAAALALQGNAQRAARLLGFSDAWNLREGLEHETAEAKSHETLVAALRTHLTADEIAAHTAAGAHLDDEQALDEALAASEI